MIMHELWLCKSILEIIKQNANKKNCTRIKKIYLEIGQLAAVEKEALNFSFSVVTQGTVAEGAELLIIDIPGEPSVSFAEERLLCDSIMIRAQHVAVIY